MAEGLPVFESGQRPLARDFQALVAAVRGLLAGGVPVLRVGGGGRVFQPFVCAGEAVQRRDGAGELVARAAEFVFEAGDVVEVFSGVDVEGVQDAVAAAEADGLPVGVQAAVGFSFDEAGVLQGAVLRRVLAQVWGNEGSFSAGGVICGGVEAAARGGQQVRRVPWVLPEVPLLVSKRQCAWFDSVEGLLGAAVVLPAPVGDEQVMVVQEQPGGAVRWRGRLDAAGILHLGVIKE